MEMEQREGEWREMEQRRRGEKRGEKELESIEKRKESLLGDRGNGIDER